MKIVRHSARARVAAVGLATTGALLLAGCGAANEGGAPAAGGDSLSGSLAGAGASAQASAMEAWVAGFNVANPGVQVTYDPVGSGGGREQFEAGATDFGGTDAYLDEEELAGTVERCGGNVIELPAYISPIAIAFNVEGVDTLNLGPERIGAIFAKQITNWNDPAIAADNEGVTLPDLPITVVHRSDESGTTENFQQYLDGSAASESWTFGVSGDWPAEVQGEAAPQNAGVVQAINAGNGTIGYAEASQVGDLGVANVRVGEEFLEYTPEAAAAVVDASPRVEGRPEGSFAIDIDRNTAELGAYPIVLVSYELACGTYEDQNTADLVKAFLSYVISEEGQAAAEENAGSAPISAEQREQFQAAIDSITAAA